MRRLVTLFIVLTLILPAALDAQQSIRSYTRDFQKRDGYFPMYWDNEGGRLLLEIPRLNEPFLYLTSLATGMGSTRLGLDRGMIGEEAIARFERTGPTVFLVFSNPRFRAVETNNPALTRSVEESFAVSTVAAFKVLAESDERVLVDVTKHVLADHMGVVRRLRGADQGTFTLDRERSRVHLPRTKGFPTNTEIEVSLTFAGDTPGGIVRAHVPQGGAITVRQHHSLVQLPDTGFSPRRGDPRIGNYTVSFYDFSRSLDERYEGGYIARHRLHKQNPTMPRSAPVEPIVYYLDRGIPEPYRTAFREGAMWWNAVFEAAGFTDAFRVEDMPPDMDPMDARYNVIQWVHRSDAGFSIGPSFVDPRTGEIIKAAVRMDSYRSLTDFNIWAGTVPAGGPQAIDLSTWLASLDPSASAAAFTMARRRQHAAHEVGHTLGLAHNFVAASYDRASVMDYPAPLIRLANGQIDLSDAYRNGPGAYDSVAIRYAYTEFPGDEEAGLHAIVDDALRRGIKFNTDGDNATWSSYPEVTQWINGADAVTELERVMGVRRHLLDQFDERVLEEGEPMVWLNYRLVPVYLHHRYALEAAIKAVGGMEFRYAVRGDTLPPTTIVPPARQRQALELVLDAVQPEALAIREDVLELLTPRAFGYGTDEWFFPSDAAPAFDQIGTARTLASEVFGNLFDRRRMARLVALHDRQSDVPSPAEVVARSIERTWAPYGEETHAALRRMVQRVVVDQLLDLAANPAATVETRATAEWGLRRVFDVIQASEPRLPEQQAHESLVWADIERFLDRRVDGTSRSAPRAMPPGTPIGQ
jgi:hypothetical protein